LSHPLAFNVSVPASQTLLFPDPRPLVERLGHDFFRQLTERPGVYLMHDAAGLVLYVGKAKNLRKRLGSYRVANPDRLGRRHLRLLSQVARIELQECEDESAALAREAELLLALKPKFNRAGVWPATPRFLIWQWTAQTLALAITETPATGWQAFGPFGSGIVYLRAALIRLLWFVINPTSGSTAMPAGWVHGRLGEIATVTDAQDREPSRRSVEMVLTELFAGDHDGFVAWVGEQTKALAHAYDMALRDADLETVIQFTQAKARRTRPFAAPEKSVTGKRIDLDAALLFTEESEAQP
jgi:predicted GIY-YIG superfamily endonuclease